MDATYSSAGDGNEDQFSCTPQLLRDHRVVPTTESISAAAAAAGDEADAVAAVVEVLILIYNLVPPFASLFFQSV